MPPNRQELEKRLRTRSLDAEAVIQRRLVTASREIENYEKYDYILVNDRLDESMDALKSILLAERRKQAGVQGQRQESADDIRPDGEGGTLPSGKCAGAVATDFGLVRASCEWALAAGENTMKLIEGFDSNYRYILVAARRARQLQGGAPPASKRLPANLAGSRRMKSGQAKLNG